ncbi:heterokaryon incompatibility protein-domain-containing protein, partial [Trichophaea hybrida]
MQHLKTAFQNLWSEIPHQGRSAESESSALPSFYLEPPSSDKNLCHICTRLDFSTILQHGIAVRDALPLGTLYSITSNTNICAFCRLVLAAIEKSWRISIAAVSSQESIECSLYCLRVSEDTSRSCRRLAVIAEPRPQEVLERQLDSAESTSNAIQLLADDVPVGRGKVHYGRLVPERKVSIGLVKEWMEICGEYHREQCERERERCAKKIPGFLRVIDVLENRIRSVAVGADVPLRYLALSYVWGGVQNVSMYQTTRGNVGQRLEVGGLEGVEFPQTIKDAMQLVAELGERYLWVDAVCIIQDDDEDRSAQIQAMDVVYGASMLTIVAAGGGDARAGLP